MDMIRCRENKFWKKVAEYQKQVLWTDGDAQKIHLTLILILESKGFVQIESLISEKNYMNFNFASLMANGDKLLKHKYTALAPSGKKNK
jgi:hypothetical protein